MSSVTSCKGYGAACLSEGYWLICILNLSEVHPSIICHLCKWITQLQLSHLWRLTVRMKKVIRKYTLRTEMHLKSRTRIWCWSCPCSWLAAIWTRWWEYWPGGGWREAPTCGLVPVWKLFSWNTEFGSGMCFLFGDFNNFTQNSAERAGHWFEMDYRQSLFLHCVSWCRGVRGSCVVNGRCQGRCYCLTNTQLVSPFTEAFIMATNKGIAATR